MNYSRKLGLVSLAAVIALPAGAADDHRYRLVDIGAFGGPNSQFSTPSSRVIDNRGVSTGVADTTTPDPTCFYDCLVDRAFVRRGNVTTELAPLAAGLSSFPDSISEEGELIVGQSQIRTVDPLTGAPELRGTLWREGQVVDLGTVGGNASIAYAVNHRGEIVGAATNGTPDPFASAVMTSCFKIPTSVCPGATFAFGALFSPSSTETHAVVWQRGVRRDLGTLGGPDSVAALINERGDVAGWSYTSFTADPSTGVPVVDGFFWSAEDHTLTDMGGLGGTFASTYWMNNRGQVTGAANLAGDTATHPFVWSKAKGMRDIGTLGGNFGHPDWINDAGDVVGTAETATNLHRAFLWRDGKMINLGTIGADRDSEATSINTRGQVVGFSGVFGVADLHGFLWEQGSPLTDLNDLLVAGTQVKVVSATDINDRGEIAGVGELPNGDQHAIVLIPCAADDPETGTCDDRSVN
jgi:probable HAF family extracellular repeat protein